MASIRVDFEAAEWTSAVPFYGPTAIYEGRDVVQLKLLSDRRAVVTAAFSLVVGVLLLTGHAPLLPALTG